MEKLYDIKLKMDKVWCFCKNYYIQLELIKQENGTCYFQDRKGQYLIINEEYIELMVPSTQVEKYPYDLYYMGEKVGKIKQPLPLLSLNASDKSWEIK